MLFQRFFGHRFPEEVGVWFSGSNIVLGRLSSAPKKIEKKSGVAKRTFGRRDLLVATSGTCPLDRATPLLRTSRSLAQRATRPPEAGRMDPAPVPVPNPFPAGLSCMGLSEVGPQANALAPSWAFLHATPGALGTRISRKGPGLRAQIECCGPSVGVGGSGLLQGVAWKRVLDRAHLPN